MDTMNRQYIDDHDVVARYLAGQLSDAERESFEAFYVANPEMLRELNRTAQFKSGLMDMKESGRLEKILRRRIWWREPKNLAIAASVALVVIGASTWMTWQSGPRPQLAATVAGLSRGLQPKLPIAGSYRIERTRSTSYDATIAHSTTAAAIELRVKPETVAVPARYRIALAPLKSDGSTGAAVSISGLAPQDDGFVPVFLWSNELTPGVYELKISGDAGTNMPEQSSSYLVEIVP